MSKASRVVKYDDYSEQGSGKMSRVGGKLQINQFKLHQDTFYLLSKC